MASNLRLGILASGVILFHTSVTVLEEQLFRNEHFRATGGGAFMTLVSYSLAAICFGAAAYRQKSAAATKGVGLVEVLGGATRAKDLLTVVTVYVGGSRVVASQIEAVLAGPPKGRTRILMTARRHPVITVAAAESAVLLLLNNQKLIKLTEKGRTTLAPCRALTDTGHTI